MKTIIIAFFNIKGIVHFEFIPQGQTVNQAYYVEILKWLLQAVPRKKPELGPNDWILHHDNAPANKALSVRQFRDQKSITEMEHPLCSPDLAPHDFRLFPKVNSALKRRRFRYTEDIQKHVTTALKAIPQQGFQKCFHQWQHRWVKCVGAQWEYFEGDPSQQALSTQV
jgi:hypothetical protein